MFLSQRDIWWYARAIHGRVPDETAFARQRFPASKCRRQKLAGLPWAPLVPCNPVYPDGETRVLSKKKQREIKFLFHYINFQNLYRTQGYANKVFGGPNVKSEAMPWTVAAEFRTCIFLSQYRITNKDLKNNSALCANQFSFSKFFCGLNLDVADRQLRIPGIGGGGYHFPLYFTHTEF